MTAALSRIPGHCPNARVLALTAVGAMPPLLLAAGVALPAFPEACLHFVRLCTASLADLDAPLHRLPVLLIAGGLLAALARRFVLLRRARVLLASLPTRSLRAGEPLQRIAERLGVSRMVVITAEGPLPAFTAGLIRPTIFVAESLTRRLDPAELEAVVLHEACHVRGRHPLRAMIAALAADAFFWLPVVRTEAEEAQAQMEFLADDEAAATVGTLVLASAIITVAEMSQQHALPATAFAARSLVPRRVGRLLGTGRARCARAARSTVGVSLAALAVLWSMALLSSAVHAAHDAGLSPDCPHAVLHGPAHQHASVS